MQQPLPRPTPPKLLSLRSVVPIAKTVRTPGGSCTFLSLEQYEDGFVMNGFAHGDTFVPNGCTDDRGRHFARFPVQEGGSTGARHYIYRYGPSCEGASRLTFTLTRDAYPRADAAPTSAAPPEPSQRSHAVEIAANGKTNRMLAVHRQPSASATNGSNVPDLNAVLAVGKSVHASGLDQTVLSLELGGSGFAARTRLCSQAGELWPQESGPAAHTLLIQARAVDSCGTVYRLRARGPSGGDAFERRAAFAFAPGLRNEAEWIDLTFEQLQLVTLGRTTAEGDSEITRVWSGPWVLRAEVPRRE